MSFGRLSRTPESRPISDINVTPMVDVMLVLLVIFIMGAPAIGASRVPVGLPSHSAAQAPAPSVPFGTLRVDAQGGLQFMGQAVSSADLPAALAQWAQASPGWELVVQADQAIPYGQVVALMDMAQAAGVSRLGLAAQGPTVAKP